MDKLPYALSDVVFPSPKDGDLWITVLHTLLADYGEERVVPEHARQAFEQVCEECATSLPVKDIIRKVRLAWLWKRPPLPRGMVKL